MECPVCNGTGIMALPRVPGARGGRIQIAFSFSGIACGACRGSGFRSHLPADTPPRPPGADEHLYAACQLLTYVLQYSRTFPASLTSDWIDSLAALDVHDPEKGRAVLLELRDSYEMAKNRSRPSRDVLSLSLRSELTFDRETREVERHLGFLEALMDHATARLADHPEDRLEHGPDDAA